MYQRRLESLAAWITRGRLNKEGTSAANGALSIHADTLITTALPSCYGRITRTQKRRTVKSAFWLNVAIKGGADQRAYTSRLRLADICVEVIPRGGGFDVALTNREAAEAFA